MIAKYAEHAGHVQPTSEDVLHGVVRITERAALKVIFIARWSPYQGGL